MEPGERGRRKGGRGGVQRKAKDGTCLWALHEKTRMREMRCDSDLKALPGDLRTVPHGPRLYPSRSDALMPSVWSGAVPFGAVYSFIHMKSRTALSACTRVRGARTIGKDTARLKRKPQEICNTPARPQ